VTLDSAPMVLVSNSHVMCLGLNQHFLKKKEEEKKKKKSLFFFFSSTGLSVVL
jgi:hypothetical protein